MSPTYGKELILPAFLNDGAREQFNLYVPVAPAPSQSLDGAERVRRARLARFQRSEIANRTSREPGNL